MGFGNQKRVSGRGSCSMCFHWSPHALYPYVGYCRLHRTVTFDDYWCEDFREMRVEKGGFYWCLTCRTRLSWEEAAEHFKRGHRVYRSAYLEPDIREEIYDAF
ncbi:hypothetical protein APE_1473a [Aeropyrum pernix K1]|uniref:Uncharacterized protein n=1 Tax=Aeropyrum pernix (strain ATCC 700893 / DSM 11879 / JCM 9820 / NBRC 100138 / K1) TaxID=272557 RepID=Q05E07_AERPE|nr:hypothetical protein APE_1473a [Aeropyrum pernix K1]